ncbi:MULTISPECIES: hypothetical protein [unclassified Paenibacillus]|uniref:hypothetical protein n=1 Tax=unclassified Paenibacillus TaxID=185978 RepID=UPI00115F7CE2|nr:MULTISPECIES: hypothetical protein [unclassified Paenibacillus]
MSNNGPLARAAGGFFLFIRFQFNQCRTGDICFTGKWRMVDVFVNPGSQGAEIWYVTYREESEQNHIK